MEEGDADDTATALREAMEEIGLDPNLVQVVANLEPFISHVLLPFPFLPFFYFIFIFFLFWVNWFGELLLFLSYVLFLTNKGLMILDSR